jgi:predicted RNA-binding Zn-ribbon protein involved in translation (DUF1610 family)
MSAPTDASRATNSPAATELLLQFLRDHDAECPACGYNLRALTQPTCPECGQPLVLTVGATRLKLGWLFVAIAPGFFSGISAAFVLVMIGLHLYFLGTTWTVIVLMDLFGWLSLTFAIVLARRRARFLSMQTSSQAWLAIGVWIVHAAALGLFILIGRALS